MGIKAKSKYITRIDAILGDRLRPEDWNAQGSKTSDIANEVITEFSQRYPEYIRTLNRRKKIKNPRRPPRWSEATLKKKEANKQKTEERARKKALYAEYKLLPKGWRKKDFNITHSPYASGKHKRGPRYTEEEVLTYRMMSVRISSFISNILIYTRRFDTTMVSSSGVFHTLLILTQLL